MSLVTQLATQFKFLLIGGGMILSSLAGIPMPQ